MQASLDDPTETVVMHRSEPSRLQSLALQLADKVNNFVDSNERIFEMKQGKLYFHFILLIESGLDMSRIKSPLKKKFNKIWSEIDSARRRIFW